MINQAGGKIKRGDEFFRKKKRRRRPPHDRRGKDKTSSAYQARRFPSLGTFWGARRGAPRPGLPRLPASPAGEALARPLPPEPPQPPVFAIRTEPERAVSLDFFLLFLEVPLLVDFLAVAGVLLMAGLPAPLAPWLEVLPLPSTEAV